MSAVYARRARPLLGTLVEVGLPTAQSDRVAAAWAAIERVQRCMSRFDAASDIARFNAAAAGSILTVHACTARVLRAARALQAESGGQFDVAQGTGEWRLEGNRLRKLHAGTRLDLGGIAKGEAVDLAVRALQRAGVRAGWVNAGGDLRAFGEIDVPVWLRNESEGGAAPWLTLGNAALATSRYAPESRSQLYPRTPQERHVSVAAATCRMADALAKVVAASGDAQHPLVALHGARAWLH